MKLKLQIFKNNILITILKKARGQSVQSDLLRIHYSESAYISSPLFRLSSKRTPTENPRTSNRVTIVLHCFQFNRQDYNTLWRTRVSTYVFDRASVDIHETFTPTTTVLYQGYQNDILCHNIVGQCRSLMDNHHVLLEGEVSR